MGENSKIPWTHHTFNPWWGCQHDHTGCLHCYAEALAKRMGQGWGPEAPRRVTGEKNWAKVLVWNREAQEAGERRRVFCASMADVFDDWSGQVVNWFGDPLFTIDGDGAFTEPSYPGARALRLDDVRKRLFHLIDATPWLDWLLLTKRPENVIRLWPDHMKQRFSVLHRPNVWLGTSVSDQKTAGEAIPELLKCRDLVPVLFLSAEPLVGPIDLRRIYVGDPQMNINAQEKVDWVIGGLESGPKFRDPGVEVLCNLARQAVEAGVPFWTKQDAGMYPDRQGRIPDAVWALKQLPRVEVAA